MRAPLSWLAEHVDLTGVTAPDLAAGLIRIGIKVERVEAVGADITDVVVARVLDIEELSGHKKPIRYVQVDDGAIQRGVICGATNFSVGDLVPLARPGATLPGGFTIAERKTYGHVSEGMICSPRELGLSEDHGGIMVLPPATDLGADIVSVLGLADDVLEIEVSPDRGYCLAIRGIAREAASALGRPCHDPVAGIDVDRAADYPVRVEDYVGCDRYVARRITGIDPSRATPEWLSRRLVLAGMRPISLAVDVTNYVLLELGQPLHAFDTARITGGIIVRRAGTDERLATLDGADRQLDPADLVIADHSGPVALAGVIGGSATEITAGTTDIVIESAHFDPASVARTARRHRLSTEASRRFARGVDDELAPVAGQRAVDLLVSLAGAVPDTGADVDGRPARAAISLPVNLSSRIAGVDYSPTAVKERLTEVGCTVAGDDPLTVRPPSWRPDLRLPIDLVEEVARLEGYDRLPATLPTARPGHGLTTNQRRVQAIGRALAGAGHVEVHTPPFVSPSIGAALLLAADDPNQPSVRITNPLSDEQSMLRASLLPTLFAAAQRNLGRDFGDLALYEIALVFRSAGAGIAPSVPVNRRPTAAELAALDAALPQQPLHLAVVLTGHREQPGWWGAGRPANWADAVATARSVADTVGVAATVQAARQPPWHPGRCAGLYVGDRLIGHAGELHPRVVANLGLPARTCAVELDLGPLLAAAPDTLPAPRLATVPVATLDVALVVAAAVPAAAVAEALRAGAGELLESLRLFDVYTGPQVGEGQRSLAFGLRLRAADRTLTTAEALAARDAAVAEAARRFGATLR